jgi:multidrug efflux pump subunit AcrB
VDVAGGLKREIRVHLDPQRLQAYNLSPERIARVLADENREMFAGRVTVETREIIARTMGDFQSIGDISNVVVSKGSNGDKVYLRDLATVEDFHEEMRVDTRFQGAPCVKVNVLKQAEANTVKVAESVKKRLEELKGSIPQDIRLVYMENQGDYVMGAIKSVRDAALLAVALVILVVYLFLGRWRHVLVMMVALPLTLMVNFLVMKIAGFSINLFSMAGIVVALSVILDNSIVVLESITRHKEGGTENCTQRGIDEVSSAISSGTLTFLAIFLPFVFVPGLASLLFKELALVVASVVVISLLVATTVTPLLTDRLVSAQSEKQLSLLLRLVTRMMTRLSETYSRFLGLCMGRRGVALAVILTVSSAGFLLASRVGSEFLPRVDDGRVLLKVKMPSGTAVGEVDRILAQLESKLRGSPDIESIFTLAGGKVWGLYTYEIANEGELDIQLVPKARRSISTQGFIEKIKPLVREVPVPGGKLVVTQQKVKGIRKVGEQEVEVKVKGTEIVPIYSFAREVTSALGQTPGLKNVNLSVDMSKPEYRVYLDRVRASDLGVSTGTVATTLRNLVRGAVYTKYREGTEYYDIRVMVPEVKIANKSDLENLLMENNRGKAIYLKDIAEVRGATGPVEIVREDQLKEVVVRADADGVSVGEAVDRARGAAAGLKPPSGVEYEMGGQAQMMAENRNTMSMVIGFGAIFAFMVLAIQFESFALPFLVLMIVPLTMTGAFLALFFTGTSVGVTVLIGIVVMVGDIISQAIVLLSLAETYRKGGLPPSDAISRAAPRRLRPILMIESTMVLGLVPLAINLGEGGDMLQPMAIAVIGGLLYSLPLTLVFLPLGYTLLFQWKDKLGGRSSIAGSVVAGGSSME